MVNVECAMMNPFRSATHTEYHRWNRLPKSGLLESDYLHLFGATLALHARTTERSEGVSTGAPTHKHRADTYLHLVDECRHGEYAVYRISTRVVRLLP